MDIFLERKGTPVLIFDMVQLVVVGGFWSVDALWGAGLRDLGLNVTFVGAEGGQLRRA